MNIHKLARLTPFGREVLVRRVRTVAWFSAQGITVERLLTDNGSACRSRHFAHVALDLGISQCFIQAYRPQTNGKAERFATTSIPTQQD